jgi:hypothetical protein
VESGSTWDQTSTSIRKSYNWVLVAHTFNLKLHRRQRSGGLRFKVSPGK